jgi:hypothetical protein
VGGYVSVLPSGGAENASCVCGRQRYRETGRHFLFIYFFFLFKVKTEGREKGRKKKKMKIVPIKMPPDGVIS